MKPPIAKFIGKMQKKSGIMKSGLEAMPLFLLDNRINLFEQLVMGPYKTWSVFLSFV